MRFIRIAVKRFRSLFRRSQVEGEMRRELDLHLAQLTKEYIAAGMYPAEARLTALRELGPLGRAEEECRDMRRVHPIEDLVTDLRYAARWLTKSPAFTLTAVLSLALTIGANTAVFSVIDALMLRTLPVRNPEQLVAFFEDAPDGHGPVPYMACSTGQECLCYATSMGVSGSMNGQITVPDK